MALGPPFRDSNVTSLGVGPGIKASNSPQVILHKSKLGTTAPDGTLQENQVLGWVGWEEKGGLSWKMQGLGVTYNLKDLLGREHLD